MANHLTVNLGVRYDHNVGTLPAQSVPGGSSSVRSRFRRSTPIKQNLARVAQPASSTIRLATARRR